MTKGAGDDFDSGLLTVQISFYLAVALCFVSYLPALFGPAERFAVIFACVFALLAFAPNFIF